MGIKIQTISVKIRSNGVKIQTIGVKIQTSGVKIQTIGHWCLDPNYWQTEMETHSQNMPDAT